MFIAELFDRLPTLINKTAEVDGIQVSINTNEKNASAYASSNGRQLGYAEFDREGNTLVPYDLAVDDKYRGQGIAAVIYDYVKSLGFTIKASPEQTDAGKYFWQKNRGDERVWEDQSVSTEDMINYIRKHHDNNLHSDYTNFITNTFVGFELRDIPVNSIKTDLPKLDTAKVEQYKKMDFSKAPPIVVGNGNILDGYHRANVAKALGIPTIKAYVGIKRVNEITMVNTQSKSKRQHLDVLPNNGQPIPEGQESEYLGDLTAEIGHGLQLWSWTDRGTVTYYVFDTRTRTSQLGTTGRPYKSNRDSFVIQGVYFWS